MKRTSFALLVALLAACNDSDASGPEPPPSQVVVQTTAAFRFLPQAAELAVGGTVTWNISPIGHSVTFSEVPGRPADIPVTFGGSVSRTFNTAGTFNYHCTVHTSPPMTGTIVVR